MSAFLDDFHFIRPFALLLLPVAMGVWWLWQRSTDPLRGWREQIEPELLNALIHGPAAPQSGPARWWLVAWTLAVIAIAGPTWRLEPSPFSDDATPLVVLLKADISMDTPDPAPSRIERAHLKIADLAEGREGLPLGLMAYAGSAHLVLPPTRDTDVVAQMAAEISPEVMPTAGDRLDLALIAADRLLVQGGQGGSLVVIADSVEVDPATLEALKLSVPIQFLAVNAETSAQRDSVERAARALGATLEPLSFQDDDVDALLRGAEGAPVVVSGEQGGRWQEPGYWILPLIALLALAGFRRESHAREVSA